MKNDNLLRCSTGLSWFVEVVWRRILDFRGRRIIISSHQAGMYCLKCKFWTLHLAYLCSLDLSVTNHLASEGSALLIEYTGKHTKRAEFLNPMASVGYGIHIQTNSTKSINKRLIVTALLHHVAATREAV